MWLFDLLGEIWDELASEPIKIRPTYEVYVDKVNMKTHKFERSSIKGHVENISDGYSVREEEPDETISRVKREHFGDRDRYIRAYSKNIRVFTTYSNNNADSYSCIFYDRYENTVIGLCLKK